MLLTTFENCVGFYLILTKLVVGVASFSQCVDSTRVTGPEPYRVSKTYGSGASLQTWLDDYIMPARYIRVNVAEHFTPRLRGTRCKYREGCCVFDLKSAMAIFEKIQPTH